MEQNICYLSVEKYVFQKNPILGIFSIINLYIFLCGKGRDFSAMK